MNFIPQNQLQKFITNYYKHFYLQNPISINNKDELLNINDSETSHDDYTKKEIINEKTTEWEIL